MSARENRAGRRPPLACNLSGAQQTLRQEEVGKLFEGCLGADELEDGYEFRFPGSAQWAPRLTEFMIEPGEGPIRVRGQEGVKDLGDGPFLSRLGASGKIPAW